MNKVLLGLVLGAVLGAIDGASAYAYPYPDVKEQIVGIIISSTFKGVLTGLLAGIFAVKFRSLPPGDQLRPAGGPGPELPGRLHGRRVLCGDHASRQHPRRHRGLHHAALRQAREKRSSGRCIDRVPDGPSRRRDMAKAKQPIPDGFHTVTPPPDHEGRRGGHRVLQECLRCRGDQSCARARRQGHACRAQDR